MLAVPSNPEFKMLRRFFSLRGPQRDHNQDRPFSSEQQLKHALDLAEDEEEKRRLKGILTDIGLPAPLQRRSQDTTIVHLDKYR